MIPRRKLLPQINPQQIPLRLSPSPQKRIRRSLLARRLVPTTVNASHTIESSAELLALTVTLGLVASLINLAHLGRGGTTGVADSDGV